LRGIALKPSRRAVLKKAVLIGAGAGGAAAFAKAKADKKAMQYQDQPKNGQKCDTCVQFVPGA